MSAVPQLTPPQDAIRVLTIVFTDLVGSTALERANGAEAIRILDPDDGSLTHRWSLSDTTRRFVMFDATSCRAQRGERSVRRSSRQVLGPGITTTTFPLARPAST